MKFFILDNDINTISMLTKVIKDKELGEVIGKEKDGEIGLTKIRATMPDIVITNLIMPKIDGLAIVKQIKEDHPNIQFIMVSEVYLKDTVATAYRYGVEYYIHKPIDIIGMEIIIKRVIDRIETNRKVLKIQEIFNGKQEKGTVGLEGFCVQCINSVLIKLGIISEKGSEDIIKICKYVIESKINLNDITLRELCNQFTNYPKSMEQRMRRSIAIGMSNIANLGLEDYMNETFIEYSNSLFNFEQVRLEMEYIRGKAEKGGSINVKKFIAGLISYCEYIDN